LKKNSAYNLDKLAKTDAAPTKKEADKRVVPESVTPIFVVAQPETWISW
jgi:hypothetical protein